MIWNIDKKKIRSMQGHLARVGTLAWNNNVISLASGSRDSMIFIHDLRMPEHHI